MNNLTRVFLVLLRLSIGWHFFFEGWDKIQSESWSSEVYLREAQGPLAPQFRDVAGDRILEQLTLQPLPEGTNPEMTSAYQRFPPALAREWDDYFERFKNHYKLDDDQKTRAESAFKNAKETTSHWLASGKVPAKIESPLAPGASTTAEPRVPERVRTYKEKLDEVRKLEVRDRNEFGGQVNTKLAAAKAEANKIRAELAAELTRQTADMEKALASVLTEEQKNNQEDPVRPKRKGLVSAVTAWSNWKSMSSVQRADLVILWGVYLVGACLLAGLLTRTACVGGAILLLMFFLAMPPLPWLPPSPRAEGHYLFINKNIIEMFALLALATTRSGYWFGVDALMPFLNPRRWRSGTAAAAPPTRRQPVAV